MTEKNVFSKISQSKAADQAVEHVEELILEGILRPGERLPAERELASQLDISRPILRDALKQLEERYLLIAKPGGGTFVADITGQVFSEPVINLICRHPKATLDYLEYRRYIEGIAAELAAQRATPSDKNLLSEIAKSMRAAFDDDNSDLESELDVELHNLIGECAHNVILLHNLRSCYRLLSDGVVFNRKMIFALEGARADLLEQHLAIIDAIISGHSDKARQAAQSHIDFIVDGFHKMARKDAREHISQLRLKQRLQS